MLPAFRAMVTPQEQIYQLAYFVEPKVGRGFPTILSGAAIDHIGFVVDPQNYSEVRDQFRSTLINSREFQLPDGDWALVGRQDITSWGACTWYGPYRFPFVVLRRGWADSGIAEGGSYAVVTYSNLDMAREGIAGHGAEFEEVTLYGKPALQVSLDGPRWIVNDKPYYGLFATDTSIECSP